MKERPIIFNAEMVRAILDGRKTQTRRIVKHKFPQLWRGGYYPTGKVLVDIENQPGAFMEFRHEQQDEAGYKGSKASALVPCPFGQPGDRLWVRETFQFYSAPGSDDGQVIFNNVTDSHHWHVGPISGDIPDTALQGYFKLVDKSHSENGAMFRVPSIHMPRWASRILLEITDVRVERVRDITGYDILAEGLTEQVTCNLHGQFRSLWESIYGDDAWERNDWVWVIEFKRVEPDQ